MSLSLCLAPSLSVRIYLSRVLSLSLSLLLSLSSVAGMLERVHRDASIKGGAHGGKAREAGRERVHRSLRRRVQEACRVRL